MKCEAVVLQGLRCNANATTPSAMTTLGSRDGWTGLTIVGVHSDGFSGDSVSGAGDVNGDGVPDLLVGAPDAPGDGNIGETYVIYGRASYDIHVSQSSERLGCTVA